MNKTELKPCPFCGGAAVNDGKEIWCAECFVNTACGISYDEAVKNWNSRAPQSEWVSADVAIDLPFESEEDPNEDGYPQFHGMVSQTVEVTDGLGRSFGHFRDDGKWIIYVTESEVDYAIVKPENVTHYKKLDNLPTPPKGE